jgi:7,8-dihydroneopterin aldolase/epimerase/oxygenase
MDKIFIRGLTLHAFHGVLKEEHVLGQRFVLHLTAWLDLSKAGKTDRLNDTVSYAELVNLMTKTFTHDRFDLIEKAAEKTAQIILEAFHSISKLELTIEKPSAPIAAVFDTVGISITRERKS